MICFVIPAQAGTHTRQPFDESVAVAAMDSRLRKNDYRGAA